MLHVRTLALAALTCALLTTPAAAAPGDPDAAFSGDGKAERQLDPAGAGARDVAVDAAHRVTGAGASGAGADERPAVVRFTAEGSPDLGFGAEEAPGGSRIGALVFNDRPRAGRWEAVALQPSTGRTIVAGWEVDANGHKHLLIAGLDAEGDLDLGFGGALSGGYIVEQWGTDTAAQDIAVQTDGRIVVVAEVDGDKIVVARYSVDGVIDDPGFGTNGRVTLTPSVAGRTLVTRAVLVDPADGDIYVAGAEHQTIDNAFYRISRLTSAGTVDPTWGTAGSENGHWVHRLGTNGGFTSIEGLGQQTDGTIVAVAGHSPFGPVGWALIDFTSTTGGTPSVNQGTSMRPHDLALSGTHVYGVGEAAGNAAVTRWDTANAGAFDSSFGGDGQVDIDFGGTDVAYGAALDGTDRLVLAGRGGNAPQRFIAARLKTTDDTPTPTPTPTITPTPTVEPDTTAPAPAFAAPGDDHRFKEERPSFTGTRGVASGDESIVYVHIHEWTGTEWKRRDDLHREAVNTGGAGWSYQVPVSIAEGTYDIEIIQLDASGNEGRARRRFRVDRTPPRVTFTTPAYDQVLRTARPVFSGKAGTEGDDRDILTGRIWQWNGSGWVRFVSDHTFVRNGDNWTWTSPVDLPSGTYDLEIEQADLADNVAAPRQRFQIDTPRLATNDGNFYLGGVAEVENRVSMGWDKPWNASPDTQYFYVWQRCQTTDPSSCKRTDEGGATRTYTDTYEVEPADRGHRLRGVMLAVNGAGTAWRATPMSAVVPRATKPPSPGSPRITGTAEVGKRLKIETGRWAGDKPIRYFTYWYRCSGFLWFEECKYTGRVNGEYPLDKGDLGHRMKAWVFAVNDVGMANAWTAQTGAVDNDRYTRRHQIVELAYRGTLGREPSASELKRWVDREDGFAAIARSLQADIRGSKNVAEAVVEAAYVKVYGHKHYSYSQKVQFAKDVKDEQSSGSAYDDLVKKYAEELVRQAHQKIFFFTAAGSKWRKPTQATVDGFVDRVRTGAFNKSVKQHGTAGEQLWTAVALSNSTVHGAARVEYPIEGDNTPTGDPKAAGREGCFGGIGPGCKGAIDPPSFPTDVPYQEFTTLDGRRMRYIRLATAIGSILHDAECRNQVYGAWCAQDGWNQLASEGLGILSKAVMPASAEWDKATTNTLTRRIWDEIYGPYPAADADKLVAGKAGDDITYSDDLRFSKGGRKAKISLGSMHTLGVTSIATLPLALVKAPYFDWTGKEVAATTRLAAPSGTKLDIWDSDFCRSKQFTGVVIWDGECK